MVAAREYGRAVMIALTGAGGGGCVELASERPGCSVGPAEHRVGLLVVDDLLADRVPLDLGRLVSLACENRADVGQVTDGRGAMADFYVADGSFPVLMQSRKFPPWLLLR